MHTDSSPPPAPSKGISPLLRHYWRSAGARPWHLFVPLALALGVAAAEGGSLALLLPLSDAIAATSFDFLRTSPAFGWVEALLPDPARNGPNRDAYLTLVILGLILTGRLVKLGLDYARDLYLDARNERYNVRIRAGTFARVLAFGRQYFDRQALGRIDTEVGWSSSVVGLLRSAE
mgnify:FL=1